MANIFKHADELIGGTPLMELCNYSAANGLKADVIFACGPMPMLRAIKKYAEEKGIKAYISLEEHMACGVGACLVCACKTKKENGEETYSHVCKNGPVFEAEKVVFDE